MPCGEIGEECKKWDVELLHQQILYPTVRVRAKKAGGSGTVLFSGQNEEKRKRAEEEMKRIYGMVEEEEKPE
ncbi:hypothetical protein DRO97_10555 [Archaeoglobales archaeon]|nr:MAG: hypothetical protein DRO97_10555 [Archaeoglobales archaeon]